MTSWLRRGQSAITFSPPSAPLKVYTRPEVDPGYNSPPAPHSDVYSPPPVPATGYVSPDGHVASSPLAPAQGGHSSPSQPAPSGYSLPPVAHTHNSQQSGYSSYPAPSIGYNEVSTPIPIIPVPTYLPIQYDMVQIPPGYQVAIRLRVCGIMTSTSCLSDSSSIHSGDCWYGSHFGNLVIRALETMSSPRRYTGHNHRHNV